MSSKIMKKLMLMIFCVPFGYLQAQFIPSQYTDVQPNVDYEYTLMSDESFGIQLGASVLWTGNNTLHTVRLYLDNQQVFQWYQRSGDSGSGLQTAGFGKMIKGPLKAGTKVRLKGVMEAPGNPSARIVTLWVGAVSYDGAMDLKNLEKKVAHLELLPMQMDNYTNKIRELFILKSDLDAFRQRLDSLELDNNQFKTNLHTRMDALDKRIFSLEENVAFLGKDLSFLDNKHHSLSNKSATDLNHIEKQLAFLESEAKRSRAPLRKKMNTFAIIGTSLGGTAALLATGAMIYQFTEKRRPSEYSGQSPEGRKKVLYTKWRVKQDLALHMKAKSKQPFQNSACE